MAGEHRMGLILSDGDTYVTLFSWLTDWLIELETDTGELISGYVAAHDVGVMLREHYRADAHAGRLVSYGDIRTIRIL